MPISTAAPKTGRDIAGRVLLGFCAAFAVLSLGGGRAGAAPATPAPTPVPETVPYVPPPLVNTGRMAYYMMQGSRIVSEPFGSFPDCSKALTALLKTLPANTAPIVCAHRRP
jgi:hypothetical protein